VIFKRFGIDHLISSVKQLLESHEHFSAKVEEEKRKKRKVGD